MINIEGITKRYGEQSLFENASFTLRQGAKIAVVGPNGAGKSTFFRILMDEESVEAGNVRKPKKCRIGLLRQEWIPRAGDSVMTSVLRLHSAWFEAKERLENLGTAMKKDTSEELFRSYHEAEEAFTALGGFGVEAGARELLIGLGFSHEQFELPASSLSGGWRMRVQLAGLLLQEPDCLLLDEPTNYLDIQTVVWFENFLQNYPNTFLMISHDHRLLNRVAEETLEFSAPKLTLWPYGIERYREAKEIRMTQTEAEIANKEKEVQRLKDFADRFRAKASKARQAQNKLKSAEAYQEQLKELKASMPTITKRSAKFRLDLKQRLPRIVMEGKDLVFGYSPEKPLFSIEELIIESSKKIGIIGANGVGKSTFLKTCAGALPHLSGNLRRHDQVTVGYFAQHRLEELPLQQNAWDYLWKNVEDLGISQVRAIAATLGIRELDLEKDIKVLSGGEKARLSLTRILLERPGCLLLDEPTNHLDMEGIEALTHGIKQYGGTVLVVSHDRDFLDKSVDRILEIQPGHAYLHYGNYAEWLRREQNKGKQEEAPTRETAEGAGRKTKEQKRQEAEERQRKYKEQKGLRDEFSKLEKDLQQAQEQGRQLDADLCLPEIAKSKDFMEKIKQRGQLTEKISVLEQRWLELTDILQS